MARKSLILPIATTFLAAAGFLCWRLSAAGWDPTALAEISQQALEGTPAGSEGYDGQFFYFIALDPDPTSVASRLDVPAYRYQRALYPLLARVLALGSRELIPWTLLLVSLIAHLIGTASVAGYLEAYGVSGWYALSYGLWVGLLGPVGLDLSEPLAYALVAAGWLLLDRGRHWPGGICLGLALFTKETTALFWAAALLISLLEPTRRKGLPALALGGLLFVAWQIWLWLTFGSPGLGSGGDLATPFEIIPFMGLLRIGNVSPALLGLYLVMFGPIVVLPTIWAAAVSLGEILRRRHSASAWSLLLNAIAIMTLPFSTFREPLAIVRLADGLLLAILFYAAERRQMRPLRYALFSIAFLVLLRPE